jgi:hypothetical protein
LVTIDFDDLLSLIMLDDYFLIANKNWLFIDDDWRCMITYKL